MSEELLVRRIAAADFAAVSALLSELGNPLPTPETHAAMHAVFLRHLDDPQTASLLIERERVPIGVLTLVVRERLSRLRPEAWIPNFIMTQHERGSGAAQVLFQAACELARALGCYRIVLESNYPLTRGHHFYLRQGMTDAGKYFTMRLDQE